MALRGVTANPDPGELEAKSPDSQVSTPLVAHCCLPASTTVPCGSLRMMGRVSLNLFRAQSGQPYRAALLQQVILMLCGPRA